MSYGRCTLKIKSSPWLLAGMCWVLAIGIGFAILWRYASTKGFETRAPDVWPAGSRLHRASGRATLLMFVHPHCPCSRASLTELDRVTARVRGRVATEVVFVRHAGVPSDLVESGLRAQAARMPDARVLDDPGGEAQRFGAETSGAVVLYDPKGKLIFTGGLTSIRGHEGDSFGQERIVSLLTVGSADRIDSPVFGCSLATKKEEP